MRRDHVPGIVFGLLLVACGVVWLASNIFKLNIDFGLLWPGFLLVPGIILWFTYLVSRDKDSSWGVLIPANILFFLGVTFFINVFVSRFLDYGSIWAWTVFMYPGSVALAFWITWAFSNKKNALIIPAVILSAISFMLLCLMSFALLFTDQTEVTKYLWPLMLVCAGSFILTSPLWGRAFPNKEEWKDQEKWKAWGENFGRKMEKMGKDVEKSVNEAMKDEKPQDVEEGELVDAPEMDQDGDK
jgi:hypothetical protein